MNPIPYGRQHITEEDLQAVTQTLLSDFLTQGPQILEFEKAFASYIGSQYALAVSNGTAALHLAAMALDVKQGTNVITTPITFAASANCIKYCGGNVYFADIDPVTYLLDLEKVEALINSKPKGFFSGIIPVDFAGRAVNLEAFKELADRHGLWLLEDACHAPGGYFTDSSGNHQNCGNCNYTSAAIFSFHPVKHIACGEGGMITTNDPAIYEKLLLLRTHGITKKPELMEANDGGWYYEMKELGYNYRLTDFQAALGLSQLKRADSGLERRKELALRYENAFRQQKGIRGQSGFTEGHAYHLYIIEVSDRLGLYNYLKQHQIFAQVHYIPVHTLPYYRQIGIQQMDLGNAEEYYRYCLSLPMYPTLTDDEQSFVIRTIQEFLNAL
ncbi:MAG TPA: UDP-4-amino-4,6-dideoxy-N-acetyl-beta-L-altrosamine transaminase [Flavisolibacter sp.]|nr:UDP-4-amino-4,6-dideoxy-N-acetyl-beta-L-altrosamine transaminase [Flavisolibacter sp.]